MVNSSASSSPTYIDRLAPRVFTQIQRVKSMTTNISPILQLQKMNKQQGPLTLFLQLKCLPPTAFWKITFSPNLTFSLTWGPVTWSGRVLSYKLPRATFRGAQRHQSLPGKLVAREDIKSGRVLRAGEEIGVPEILRSEKFSIFWLPKGTEVMHTCSPEAGWVVQTINIPSAGDITGRPHDSTHQ